MLTYLHYNLSPSLDGHCQLVKAQREPTPAQEQNGRQQTAQLKHCSTGWPQMFQ